MNYRKCLIFVLCLLPGIISGQSLIDSLETQLKFAGDDTIRLDILNELIFKTSFYNPDRAIERGNEAMSIGEKINDQKRMANTYNALGVAYNLQGNFLSSIDHFLDALRRYEQTGDNKKMANVLNNIGITYDELGNYEKAKLYYMESLDSYSNLNEPYAKASILNNIGTAYEALEQMDSALYYYSESLNIAMEYELSDKLADAYLNLGNLSNKSNHSKKAIQYLDRALSIDISNDYKSGQVDTYTALSQSWLKEKNYPKAYEYLQKAYDISIQQGMTNKTAKILRIYSEYYAEKNDFKRSLKYFKDYSRIHDSIFNLETSRQIEDLIIHYESDKAAREISILTEKNQTKDTQLRFQRDKSRLMLIITLLAIVSAGLLWINSRLKTRANKQLNLKNEKIREQNKTLEEHAQQLKVLDREKDNFLSLVAHDLKSPLNKIQGLTNLINATGPLNEEQKDYLILMSRISNDARMLIENILELSLLESGKLIIQTERIEICDFIRSLTEEYIEIADQKKIKILFQSQEELFVDTNREFIKRITDNLLSNAIKFSPNGKEIEIDCGHDKENSFYILIKDQGPGIKTEEKERLFVKYQKLSAKPTAGESSTGLGLAIVKLLIDYLGGVIEVNSIEKSGTTFVVRLPLEYEEGKQLVINS